MLTQTEALRERSREFAVRVLKFVKRLPHDAATETVARQLARSGTGLSSNYHSACRARSRAEFISRMAVAVDEADESWHWLVVLRSSELASGGDLEWLVLFFFYSQESSELRSV